MIGILPALELNALDWMDRLAGHVLLVAGGLALAIFVGWVMQDPFAEIGASAKTARWPLLWRWLLRIPVPLVLVVVLYEALQALF